ncbi:dTDP-4-dehydrorhamnose 3,5-epimerase [Reyranella sp. CPCC 100927]|nr:dTDP-4-dehydrorhamnose 3,5-epimerase [Reyranella sp. CPCC 100927]
MTVEKTEIADLVVVSPEVFEDARGFFMEVYKDSEYAPLGLPSQFVQFNHSGSVKNTVRGLHFQWDPPMGKLMRVARGTAFLVAVDIRKGSPTLGKHKAFTFSERDRKLVWAPAGFARGFAVLSDFAEIEYLTTGAYNSKGESGILWDDPALGIAWPVNEPILSGKDQKAQTLAQWLDRSESSFFKV